MLKRVRLDSVNSNQYDKSDFNWRHNQLQRWGGPNEIRLTKNEIKKPIQTIRKRAVEKREQIFPNEAQAAVKTNETNCFLMRIAQ